MTGDVILILWTWGFAIFVTHRAVRLGLPDDQPLIAAVLLNVLVVSLVVIVRLLNA